MVRRQQGGVPQGGQATARGWWSSTTPRAPSPSRTGTSSRRRSPAAGGSQGFHGPKHVFTVKKTDVKHPISEGLPAEFEHTIDELYQNSVMVPGNDVLATAYSDPGKPQGHRQGRAGHLGQHLRQGPRLQQRPGPRRRGHVRPQLPGLDAPGRDLGGDGEGGVGRVSVERTGGVSRKDAKRTQRRKEDRWAVGWVERLARPTRIVRSRSRVEPSPSPGLPRCGATTCANLPAGVRRGCFGPCS